MSDKWSVSAAVFAENEMNFEITNQHGITQIVSANRLEPFIDENTVESWIQEHYTPSVSSIKELWEHLVRTQMVTVQYLSEPVFTSEWDELKSTFGFFANKTFAWNFQIYGVLKQKPTKINTLQTILNLLKNKNYHQLTSKFSWDDIDEAISIFEELDVSLDIVQQQIIADEICARMSAQLKGFELLQLAKRKCKSKMCKRALTMIITLFESERKQEEFFYIHNVEYTNRHIVRSKDEIETSIKLHWNYQLNRETNQIEFADKKEFAKITTVIESVECEDAAWLFNLLAPKMHEIVQQLGYDVEDADEDRHELIRLSSEMIRFWHSFIDKFGEKINRSKRDYVSDQHLWSLLLMNLHVSNALNHWDLSLESTKCVDNIMKQQSWPHLEHLIGNLIGIWRPRWNNLSELLEHCIEFYLLRKQSLSRKSDWPAIKIMIGWYLNSSTTVQNGAARIVEIGDEMNVSNMFYFGLIVSSWLQCDCKRDILNNEPPLALLDFVSNVVGWKWEWSARVLKMYK